MTACVHCIAAEATTKDHLIPQSWYPESTPKSQLKLWFPSCAECNNLYSKIEDRLLSFFGLCLDPEDARAARLPERALRSMTPAAGRNERDQSARRARRSRIWNEVHFSREALTDGVLPGFGPLPDTACDEYGHILVSVDDLSAMVRKFAKGLAYIQSTALIGPEYQICWCPMDEFPDAQIEDILTRFAQVFSPVPGIRLDRAAAVTEDPTQCFMRIELWSRFHAFAFVCRASEGESGQNWIVA